MAAAKLNPTRRASFSHPLLIDRPKKICLFRADSLARHRLQLVCDSGVGAMHTTYLIELVQRYAAIFGTIQRKSTITEISGLKFGTN